MKKRLLSKALSVLIAAATLLALLPTGLISVSAATASSGMCGDCLTWDLDTSGNLTISGTGEMYDYDSIRDYYGNFITTAPWGINAKTVSIYTGVTSIGKCAFYGSSSLISLTIPDSVTSIRDYAFMNCSLTSVIIPKAVTFIGEGALQCCNKLVSITVEEGNPAYHSTGNCVIENDSKILIIGCNNSSIPSDGSVTAIGNWSFYECDRLKSAVIANGVTSIGDGAFYHCTNLESITIPDSVTYLGNSAFLGCTSLTDVVIPNSIISINNYAFYGCTNLTSITLPSRVTDIGAYAFYGCTDLTNATIPSGVTSIGDSAFYGCDYLTLYVTENSYAHNYAIDNSFKYELIVPTFAKGDLDEDGVITVYDALDVLRVAAGLVPPSEKRLRLGEIDGDGVITVYDALLILRVAAKLADSL